MIENLGADKLGRRAALRSMWIAMKVRSRVEVRHSTATVTEESKQGHAGADIRRVLGLLP